MNGIESHTGIFDLVQLTHISFVLTFKCDEAYEEVHENGARRSHRMVLPLSDLERILKELLAFGLQKDIPVAFTGGEPFLYESGADSLVEAVIRTRELGFSHIEIETCGWTQSRDYVDYERIFNTLIGLTDRIDLCINLRVQRYQAPGTVARMLHMIQKLWDHDMNPSVTMTVDIDNYLESYLDFYSLLLLKLKATPQTEFGSVLKRAEKGDFSFAPNRFVSQDHSLVLKPNPAIKADRTRPLPFQFAKSANHCEYLLNGKRGLLFGPTGEVYFCQKPDVYDFMPPLGNLLQEMPQNLFGRIQDFCQAFKARFASYAEETCICESCAEFCRTFQAEQIPPIPI